MGIKPRTCAGCAGCCWVSFQPLEFFTAISGWLSAYCETGFYGLNHTQQHPAHPAPKREQTRLHPVRPAPGVVLGCIRCVLYPWWWLGGEVGSRRTSGLRWCRVWLAEGATGGLAGQTSGVAHLGRNHTNCAICTPPWHHAARPNALAFFPRPALPARGTRGRAAVPPSPRNAPHGPRVGAPRPVVGQCALDCAPGISELS
jgi:hypothetical protein